MNFSMFDDDEESSEQKNRIFLDPLNFLSVDHLPIMGLAQDRLFQNKRPSYPFDHEEILGSGQIFPIIEGFYCHQGLPAMPEINQEVQKSQQRQSNSEPDGVQNSEQKISYKNSSDSGKQGKKSSAPNSIYHNFQKHLNSMLKKLIVLPMCKGPDKIKLAAGDLWKRFVRCKVKTRKILHCIFNEKNEHSINDIDLKTYGLLDSYNLYGEDTISRARSFLSQVVSKQLGSPTLDRLLLKSRMKNIENFKQYVLNFRSQLKKGFLTRRVLLGDKQTPIS